MVAESPCPEAQDRNCEESTTKLPRVPNRGREVADCVTDGVSGLYLCDDVWLVMEYHTNLASPLIALFFTGTTVTGAVSGVNTLVVDINVKTPAPVTAASDLFRCLFGAGAVAAPVPLIERIGMGSMGSFIATLWLVLSPMLWIVWYYGRGWRDEKVAKDEKKEKESAERKDASDVEKYGVVSQNREMKE